MKIETKYDIGDEVWIGEDLYNKRGALKDTVPVLTKIEKIVVYMEDLYTYELAEGSKLSEQHIYQTKEEYKAAN